MSENKKETKFTWNPTTIMLAIILILTMFNGCQSCSNRSAIKQNKKQLQSAIDQHRQENISSSNMLSKMHSTNAKYLEKVIEQNAEAGVIIEKEIDRDATLKPTQVKEMFKQHREYEAN